MEIVRTGADWQARAIDLVTNTVASRHSRRIYRAALLRFFAWCEAERRPFNRETLQAYKAVLQDEGQKPQSINVHLAAIRGLAREAEANGLLDAGTAAGIQNVRSEKKLGQTAGNWLSLPQCRSLLLAPDQETLIGKRDRCVLALLATHNAFITEGKPMPGKPSMLVEVAATTNPPNPPNPRLPIEVRRDYLHGKDIKLGGVWSYVNAQERFAFQYLIGKNPEAKGVAWVDMSVPTIVESGKASWEILAAVKIEGRGRKGIVWQALNWVPIRFTVRGKAYPAGDSVGAVWLDRRGWRA